MDKTSRQIYLLMLCIVLLFVAVAYEKWLKKDALKKKVKNRMSWRKIRWQTGDVLLFSGTKSPIYHYVFKAFLRSPVHHVGIVYVDPVTRVPYIWEMFEGGITVIPIEDVGKRRVKYDIAVRQWNRPGLFPEHLFYPYMHRQIQENKPFNFDVLSIINRQIFGQTQWREGDDDAITCGTFIGNIIRDHGLFYADTNTAMLLPPNYLDDKLPYSTEYRLGEPIFVEDLPVQ